MFSKSLVSLLAKLVKEFAQALQLRLMLADNGIGGVSVCLYNTETWLAIGTKRTWPWNKHAWF